MVPKNPLVGKEVSINLKQTSFWGIGSLWLSTEIWHDTIPADLTDEEFLLLRQALLNGDILLGKRQTAVEDRQPTLLQKYIRLAATSRDLTPSYKKEIAAIALTNKLIGGYHPREILEHMLREANQVGATDSVFRFLREGIEVALQNFPHYSPPPLDDPHVEIMPHDPSQDKTVMIDPISRTIVGKATEPTRKGSRKKAKEALDDLTE